MIQLTTVYCVCEAFGMAPGTQEALGADATGLPATVQLQPERSHRPQTEMGPLCGSRLYSCHLEILNV